MWNPRHPARQSYQARRRPPAFGTVDPRLESLFDSYRQVVRPADASYEFYLDIERVVFPSDVNEWTVGNAVLARESTFSPEHRFGFVDLDALSMQRIPGYPDRAKRTQRLLAALNPKGGVPFYCAKLRALDAATWWQPRNATRCADRTAQLLEPAIADIGLQLFVARIEGDHYRDLAYSVVYVVAAGQSVRLAHDLIHEI